MIIRDATVDDAHGIAVAHARSWQVGYAGLVPDRVLDAIDVAQWATQRAEWLRDLAPRICLVAEVAGQVRGFVFAGTDRGGAGPGIAEVYAIYVHPDHWGGGAGRRLLTAAMQRLADQGFTEARLWVLRDNVRSRRFYERNSFTFDGTEEPWSPRDAPEVSLVEVRYRRLIAQRDQ